MNLGCDFMTWERMQVRQTPPVDNHCSTALCLNCNEGHRPGGESSELTGAGRGRGKGECRGRGGAASRDGQESEESRTTQDVTHISTDMK